MNNKRYIVEFTADDTRDYSVNIETALLEHFDENMSMSGCEDLHVREEKYFDETYWEDYIYNAILSYGAENASQLWEYCSYECEGLITKEKFIEIAEFWYS